jgi:hypothetical protein
MTHSLHREGSLESLKNDFVMIFRTSKVNKAVTSPKLPRIAKMVFEVGPSNTGSSALRTNVPLGFDPKEFTQGIAGAHGFLCTFSSKEKVREMLRRLKEAGLGVSITVSGVVDEVVPMAQELGIKPHTINLSMGMIGRKELLAEPEVREMTTMCGHAMIAANLVKKGIADVASGAKSPREASNMLGRPCVCGIYNLDRSDALLAAEAQKLSTYP